MKSKEYNSIHKENMEWLRRHFRQEYDLVYSQKELAELLADCAKRKPEILRLLIS